MEMQDMPYSNILNGRRSKNPVKKSGCVSEGALFKMFFSALRGKAVYSFEYDKERIKYGIAIDPGLPLFPGLHYSSVHAFLPYTSMHKMPCTV
jgi:hypothetical protein